MCNLGSEYDMMHALLPLNCVDVFVTNSLSICMYSSDPEPPPKDWVTRSIDQMCILSPLLIPMQEGY